MGDDTNHILSQYNLLNASSKFKIRTVIRLLIEIQDLNRNSEQLKKLAEYKEKSVEGLMERYTKNKTE